MGARFYFADIVVGRHGDIGCVLKTWHNRRGYHYDVYWRINNCISEVDEIDLIRYVASKKISEEEEEWHVWLTTIAEIAAANPGWHWQEGNPQTGTVGQFVKDTASAKNDTQPVPVPNPAK